MTLLFSAPGNISGASFAGVNYPAVSGLIAVPDGSASLSLVSAFAAGGIFPASAAQIQGVASSGVTPSQPVTLTALPALAAGAATIGAVGQAGGPWSVSWSGQSVTLGAGSAAIGSVSVTGNVAVTGTFFQATQPISAAALPLPAGAATAANQPAVNTDGGALAHITNFPASQPVTLAALPALAAGSAAIGSVSVTGNVTVTDAQNAAYQGVVSITPGTPVAAARSLGYVCTNPGNITLTLADTSTITLALQAAGGAFQTFPFAVVNIALSGGATGSFWNLK